MHRFEPNVVSRKIGMLKFDDSSSVSVFMAKTKILIWIPTPRQISEKILMQSPIVTMVHARSCHMGVSQNRGTPKASIYIRFKRDVPL